VIEPLLPEESPRPKGGRPRIDDRAALTGIIFVLKSGIPWEMLPQEMGCCSGMNCWRRLKEWQEAGVGKAASEAPGPFRRSRADRVGEGFIGRGECGRPPGAKRQAPTRQIRARRRAGAATPRPSTTPFLALLHTEGLRHL
jgi:hypothetical protein